MKLSVMDDLLWAGGFLSSVVLLLVLLWRARWREYPILTCWIAYQTALPIVLFVLYMRGAVEWYSRVYWTCLWPDFFFQLGVAAELGRIVFRPHGRWVWGARGLFSLAVVGAIAAGAILSWMIQPPHGGFTTFDLRSDLFTSLVTCELLLGISIIAHRLGLLWPREALSVTQGLTAWSMVIVVVNALQSYFGARNFRLINHFAAFAWIGAMAWIAIEFGAPRAEDEFPERFPARPTHQASDTLPPCERRPQGWRNPLPVQGPSLARILKAALPLRLTANGADEADS